MPRRRPGFAPKPNTTWNGMTYTDRRAWLSPLGPQQIAQQARVRAQARGCSFERVLADWVSNGMISRARMAAALAANQAALEQAA